MANPAIIIIGAGLVRSIAGWLENALEDGKISDYEWKLLGSTIIRVGFFGAIAYYFPGLNLSGLEASACGLAGDFLLQAVKKRKK